MIAAEVRPAALRRRDPASAASLRHEHAFAVFFMPMVAVRAMESRVLGLALGPFDLLPDDRLQHAAGIARDVIEALVALSKFLPDPAGFFVGRRREHEDFAANEVGRSLDRQENGVAFLVDAQRVGVDLVEHEEPNWH